MKLSRPGGTPRIAVCGAGNAGLAIAADCAFKGLSVTLFELPELADRVAPLAAAGGVETTPDSQTTSGRTGFAKLDSVTTDAAEAVAGADVVMVSVPGMYHTTFVRALLPHLHAGQILLFNTAFWGSLRHARMVHAAAPGVILADSSIMPYAAQRMADDRVHISLYKRTFAVAALPGRASAAVCDVLKGVYEQYEPVDTVLDVNVAHASAPGITLPMILPVAGLYFDRYLGGKFYADATLMGARLVEAYEQERAALSRRLGGIEPLSFPEWQSRSYGYAVDRIDQMMRKSDLIDWYATAPYVEQLIDEYTVYCWIPMLELADAAGVDMPATRAMVTVMGIMLGKDYWELGAASGGLGLQGLTAAQIESLLVNGIKG